MRLQFYTLIILFFPIVLTAQKINNMASFRNIAGDSYFRFNYENDYFAATDRDYTQGYSFEVVTPLLAKNPINKLFVSAKNSRQKYGLAIEHNGYTPYRYESDQIQYGDRPFAAAIMLKSFKISTDTIKKSRISAALNLGLIGPGAFGGEMQTAIHEATGNDIPQGWQFQIKNDIVLNYEINYERQLLRYQNYFLLQGNGRLRLGTLNTDASVGIATMIGLFSADWDNTIGKPKYQFYLYSQPLLSLIAYDATLQGGIFNDDSPYTISSNNVRRFTGQNNYGIVIQTRTMFFEYSRSVITREFSTGRAAGWGGIKIGFKF